MRVLSLSIVVAALDQVLKDAIRRDFRIGESLSVFPGFFNLRYVRNTGAAWGMLAGFNDWLVLFSAVMLLVIVVFRRHFLSQAGMDRLAMGLMVGGIAGNLVDRIRLSYVVDFLDFHWRGWHFPAFNLADAAICTGVGLYLLSQARASRRDGNESQNGAAAAGREAKE